MPIVGIIALGLLFGQLLLFGPIEIWSRNAAELIYAGRLHAAIAVVTTVTIVALLAWFAAWVPRPARDRVSAVVAGTAILAWIYSNLLFRDSLQLSGRESGIDLSAPLGWVEVALVVALLAAGAWQIPKAARQVGILLAILLAGQILITAYRVVAGWSLGITVVAQDPAPLLRHSRKGNVIVVLLDTLQSDVASELLRGDAALRHSLRGFTYYPDTVGVAPTTFPSLITLHTGAMWDGKRSLADQYHVDIQQGSFLTDLAKAGYETVLVNPIKAVCPDNLTGCYDSMLLSGRSTLRRLGVEWAGLVDLSLLRAAPFYFKSAIFNSGAMFLTRLVAETSFHRWLVEDVALMERIAAKVIAHDGEPNAKFIHMLGTHPPYVLGQDCQVGMAVIAGGHVNAARCALRALARYLDKLRDLGVLDQSLIIVTADHGGMRPMRNPDGSSMSAPADLKQRAAAASPLLMIKGLGEKGDWAQSPEPKSLLDIRDVICTSTQKCPPGQRTGAVRHYRDYAWTADGWMRAHLPSLHAYTVLGPVWDENSWHDASPAEAYALGTPLDFHSGGQARSYLAGGFGPAEPWGAWIIGHRATMRFSISAAPAKDLTMTMFAHAFLAGEHKRQRVDVIVNGQRVDTWVIEGSELKQLSAVIPREVALRLAPLEIRFDVADPRAPHDLGVNSDTRLLGLGVARVQID